MEEFSVEIFRKYLVLIHDLTGITITENRKSMVHGRIRKRLIARKMDSYEEYYRFVKQDAQEKVAFIDAVTTNETYFYRTPRIWEYVEREFLKNWMEEKKGIFHAWSAAASSGEEAHTLGTLLQNVREQNPTFQYRILGTDISQEMVARCEAGMYGERAVARFRTSRPEIYQKYVKKENDVYTVDAKVRSNLKFRVHNLFNRLVTPNKFDLILLRNVLIYFSPDDQKKVIEQAGAKLAPHGLLVIGESESLNRLNTGFVQVSSFVYKMPDSQEKAA